MLRLGRSARSHPSARAIAGLLSIALVTAACSGGGDGDEDTKGADKAADDLAKALAAGDVATVEFSGEGADAAAEDYETTVAGMGEIAPQVTASKVSAEGAKATAALSWTWPVAPGQQWTYTTEAAMSRSGEKWLPLWDRALVWPSLTQAKVLESTPIEPARGQITGADGVNIVTDRSVVSVGVDLGQTPRGQAGAVARRVASLTDIDIAAYLKQVQLAGDKAFVEAITYRFEELPPAVRDGVEGLTGARLVADERPLAPSREFAAPILGTVGPVTKEMVDEDPGLYQPGDQAGVSGLQARYDEQLRGTPGVVINAVDDGGQETQLFRAAEQPGKALATTLDEGLQGEAEAALASLDADTGSALVAIRPSTGAIVAAANGAGNEGQNLATFGRFAPGSTFKSVTALALSRGGVQPTTRVDCPPTIDVDGKQFKNYSDYPASALGRITMRQAIANSCNTALIGERDRLGELDLFDAAASLGMGVDHDLGFPAYFGQVEPAASETEAGANLIGQGRILASPMVMATVIASVQSGGLVVPRLLEDVKVTDHEHKALTDTEAQQLREMLRAVVTEGSGSGLADVPGAPVIAKTGTAEFQADAGVETHAWMIAAQGDLAVAVFVEEGQSGSVTAGPVIETFLRAAR